LGINLGKGVPEAVFQGHQAVVNRGHQPGQNQENDQDGQDYGQEQI
jgi:hypothetical protein